MCSPCVYWKRINPFTRGHDDTTQRHDTSDVVPVDRPSVIKDSADRTALRYSSVTARLDGAAA